MLPVQLLGVDLNTNLTNKYHRSHHGAGTKLLACKDHAVLPLGRDYERLEIRKAVVNLESRCACCAAVLAFP